MTTHNPTIERRATRTASVVAVVLSYNRRDDLLDCLRALEAADPAPLAVVVVDNASADGSPEAVKQFFPDVHLLVQARNLGAPGGRNAGMRYAEDRFGHDYVLFLDDDSLVEPDCIGRLCDALATDPKAGVACGKTYCAYPSRTILSAGISANLYTGAIDDRGAGIADHGQFDRPCRVDAAGAFAFLIRRDLLRRLDGFDERYSPYGWEDVDLGLRARRCGYACTYVPGAIACHKGTKLGRGPKPGYERTKVRNYIRLLITHANPLQLLTCAVAVPVRAIPLMGRLLWQGHFRVVGAQLQGLSDSCRGMLPTGGRKYHGTSDEQR